MRLQLIHWAALDAARRTEVLLRPPESQDPTIKSSAATIVDTVRKDGDRALAAMTLEFDNASVADLRVSQDEIRFATSQLSTAEVGAIDRAISNVRAFHEVQLPSPITVETMPGVRCERVSHALDSVGLYVPAGTAPLPSAAIMLAVPAVIAACPRIVMCTPPRPDGTADAAVLAAASRAGVEEIYKVGGAQAIAAMAYGTETVPKVRKIFGPGNAWVTAAKTLVSTDPQGAAIDMPAGPSEVLVIADDTASVEYVSADLLSQAEHGIDSQVLLITTSETFATAVQQEVDAQLRNLSRAETAAAALENSRIIVVRSVDEAIAVSNRYAPEHLILQVDSPSEVVGSVRNAGSVFVGPWTPESVGDYCSGTNHVLPTYGYASTYSGLGVDQYMRQMTVQELTRDGLTSLAPTVTSLARLEGLDAHAAAVTRRLGGAS